MFLTRWSDCSEGGVEQFALKLVSKQVQQNRGDRSGIGFVFLAGGRRERGPRGGITRKWTNLESTAGLQRNTRVSLFSFSLVQDNVAYYLRVCSTEFHRLENDAPVMKTKITTVTTVL